MYKFWSLIIISFILSLLLFLKAFQNYTYHNQYYPKYNNINIIVETNNSKDNDIALFVNNKIYKKQNNNLLNVSLKEKVEGFELFVDDENDIKNIVIYNGVKAQFYKDLSTFKKTDKQICDNSKCFIHTSYFKDINNENSVFNKFSAYVISFIEGNIIFIIPYILLFVALLYFKDKYINNKLLIILTILFCILLRIINISRIPIGDECYSLAIIQGSLKNIFKDPGNPFLFYLIIKIYGLITNNNIILYRILNILFNILCVVSLGFILNKKFNINATKIAIFLASINMAMIYYASEIRSYSLQMLLSVLIVYFLFEAMQKRKNIYYFIYTLLGIVAINTHYYEILFLLGNFIFAIFYLGLKRKKYIFKFLVCNLIIFASFIPYFIYTSINKALLDSTFNEYLDSLSFNLIINQIKFIFGSILSFLLSVFFFFKIIISKKISKKRKLWIFYLFFSVLFILLSSIIVSLIIRPVIAQRYFCPVLPLFIAFVSIIFTSYDIKKYKIIFFGWVLFIQFHAPIQNARLYFEHELNIFKIIQENKNYKHTYLLLRPGNIHHSQIKNNEIDKNIKIEVIKITPKNMIQTNVQNSIDDILDKDKDAIIYTTMLNANKDNINNKNYTCYYNSTTDLCLWKITKN